MCLQDHYKDNNEEVYYLHVTMQVTNSIKLFGLMKNLRTKPNNINFVCILIECRHAGLVDEVCKYFNNMSDSYCIITGMNHYMNCFTFYYVGYLKEALNFITKIPIKHDIHV